jgi:DNA-binding CsgD family transcriptional regulator
LGPIFSENWLDSGLRGVSEGLPPRGRDDGQQGIARSLCEGSDVPDAEGTRTAVTRVRRPRGQRAQGRLLERPSRKQRVERIEALAARGLGSEEIAARLGLARSTVNKYRRDPEGERERVRRERYRGRCRGCGRPTRGSDGPGRAPEWCPECAPARRRRWSDAQMLEAIREWTRLTGAPPTLYDWSPAHAPAGHPGAARYLAERGRWPNASSVARRFGSLRGAVEAAGVAAKRKRR